MRSETKKYVKACRNILPFYGSKERAFVKKLSEQLEMKNGSFTEICEEIGTPKETALSYFESCDSEYLLKMAKIRSFIKKLLIAMLVILIVSVTYLTVMAIIYQNAVNEQQIIECHEEIVEIQ